MSPTNRSEKPCTYPGCDSPLSYAKGLCTKHYRLEQKRMANDETGDTPATGEGGDPGGEADAGGAVLGDGPGAGPVSDSAYGPTPEQRPQGVGTPSSPGAVAGESRPAAPESKVKQLLGKIRGGASGSGRGDTASSAPAPATKEKRPHSKGAGKRISAAGTIEDIYSGIGGLAIRTGNHAPLGRCMQWQAPMAGEMLDEAIAGTIIDKVALQRIEKGRARYDLLGAVFGPPLLVMAIERNPQNAPALMPMLAASIRHSLPLMVPAIKKAKAREKAVAEATAELFADDPEFLDGTDPVEYILGQMFAGWVPPAPPDAGPPQEVPDLYQDQGVG